MNLITRPAVWKSIQLPDGGQIILASEYQNGSPLSLYDINHNIFRLNSQDKVVWQVQRDEQGQYDWEKYQRASQEAGLGDCRCPFTSIREMIVPSGEVYEGGPMPSGIKLIALANNYTMPARIGFTHRYEIDIETGLAVNITAFGEPTRPW